MVHILIHLMHQLEHNHVYIHTLGRTTRDGNEEPTSGHDSLAV